MKRLSVFGCLSILVLLVVIPAHASLTVVGVDSSGNQLIYDTGLNITWYDYTYRGPTDIGATWSQANTWAQNLNVTVNGTNITGWRLPRTLPVNGSTYNYPYSTNGSADYGYNISAPGSVHPGSTASEMAYLYYVDLGNKAPYDVNGNRQSSYGLANTDLYKNLVPEIYWSGTEATPYTGWAWNFSFVAGFQDYAVEGSHTHALAVHDGNVGNSQWACMHDKTSPVITMASVNPSVLWPPNHKMVDVTVNYTATDNCGQPACTISGVTSNEPISSSDYSIVDAHHVKLSADRLGSGNGRIYTISIACTDASGNSSTQTMAVSVPHDQGKN